MDADLSLRPLDEDEAVWLASEAVNPPWRRDRLSVIFVHEEEKCWSVCFEDPEVEGERASGSRFTMNVSKATRAVKPSWALEYP